MLKNRKIMQLLIIANYLQYFLCGLYATIKSCMSFRFFNIYLFSRNYSPFNFPLKRMNSAVFLLTNCDVIKLIKHKAELKRIFSRTRFSRRGEFFEKKLEK